MEELLIARTYGQTKRHPRRDCLPQKLGTPLSGPPIIQKWKNPLSRSAAHSALTDDVLHSPEGRKRGER